MKDKKKKDLLKYIKKYYDHYKSNNFSPHYDTPFYLATYSGGSIGYELLKRLIGLPNKYLSNFIVILKDLFFFNELFKIQGIFKQYFDSE